MKRGALLAAAALGALAVRSPVRAANVPLRLGDQAIDSSTEVLCALDQGYYDRAGLDVSLEQFINGSITTAALIGGTLDLAASNTLSFASAFEKKLPLKIIASGAVYDGKAPTTVMIVAKDSKLRTARDLTGQTVAVNVLGGIAHVAAQAWVDQNGGDSKQVRFTEAANTEMAAAVAGGRYAAGVLPEPFVSEARDTIRVFADAFDGIADRWMIDVFVASEPWIAQHGDLTRRFRQANQAAAVWANHHHDQTAVILSKAMRLDVNVIRGMTRATFLEHPDPNLLQPVLDAGLRYGVISSHLQAADLFIPEALRE